ncbi:MAG TPA: histone H1 [Xanthobacteraceae bacterium]|nr:histone H1 [Xanthobacteraceae bacterium]
MTAKRLKRPRDPVQLGKLIGDILTGQVEDRANPAPADANKDPAAVALGRRGGLKGGRVRADSLTPDERRKIAQDAANKRWSKK